MPIKGLSRVQWWPTFSFSLRQWNSSVLNVDYLGNWGSWCYYSYIIWVYTFNFKKGHFYSFSWCFTESCQIVTGTAKWLRKRKLLGWVRLYSLDLMECSEGFKFLTLLYPSVSICFCYQIDYCKSDFLLAFICHSEMISEIIMHILL